MEVEVESGCGNIRHGTIVRACLPAIPRIPAAVICLYGILAGQSLAPRFLGESTVGSDPQGDVGSFGALNGKSHQQDILVSHRGWQYTAYYNSESPRRIVLARRNLSSAQAVWEKFVFRDYAQTTDDGHNVISLGMSPEDGTLHLAFDHHASDLHYRRSVPGLIDNPGQKPWEAGQFSATTSLLANQAVDKVTYPRFLTAPDGRLLLSYRYGGSGNGDEILWEYGAGTWSRIGPYIEGGTANAYLDGLAYGMDGRLHATWIWRETPDASTNHDICHAYSPDHGRSWYNSRGQPAGTAGQAPMHPNTPGITAVPIPQNRGLMNQEGMTVDRKGRPHAVHALGSQVHHYFLDQGGIWRDIAAGFNRSGRMKIAVDALNNAYILFDGLQIAAATDAAGYRDWKIVDSRLKGRFATEPHYDRYLLATSNVLSVYVLTGDYRSVQVVEYKLAGDVSSIRAPSRRAGPVAWATGSGIRFDFLGRRWGNEQLSNPGNPAVSIRVGTASQEEIP